MLNTITKKTVSRKNAITGLKISSAENLLIFIFVAPIEKLDWNPVGSSVGNDIIFDGEATPNLAVS